VELQLYPDSNFELDYYHHLTNYEILAFLKNHFPPEDDLSSQTA